MNMRKIIMMLMLLMSSMTSVAQDGVLGSGIAIVEDHKRQRRVYALRTAIEEANRELHGLVADTVKGYKEVNFSLEKYTKSFELIQLILNGAYTAMNIYGTSNYVVGRVGDISRLLTEYYNELLSQGNIESGDLFIYEWSNQLVRGLSEDVSELVRSLGDMPLYINGKVHCTTANLLLIIDNINKTLNKIKERVAAAHMKIYGYIKARLSPFWNRRIYHSETVMTIATDALSRWLQNAQAGSR
jgi:hypothetical protein